MERYEGLIAAARRALQDLDRFGAPYAGHGLHRAWEGLVAALAGVSPLPIRTEAHRPKHEAIKCPCRQPVCQSWLVTGVADVQGVHFSEEEARAVADLLNRMAWPLVGAEDR